MNMNNYVYSPQSIQQGQVINSMGQQSNYPIRKSNNSLYMLLIVIATIIILIIAILIIRKIINKNTTPISNIPRDNVPISYITRDNITRDNMPITNVNTNVITPTTTSTIAPVITPTTTSIIAPTSNNYEDETPFQYLMPMGRKLRYLSQGTIMYNDVNMLVPELSNSKTTKWKLTPDSKLMNENGKCVGTYELKIETKLDNAPPPIVMPDGTVLTFVSAEPTYRTVLVLLSRDDPNVIKWTYNDNILMTSIPDSKSMYNCMGVASDEHNSVELTTNYCGDYGTKWLFT